MFNDRLTEHDPCNGDTIYYAPRLHHCGHEKAARAVLERLAYYEDAKKNGRLFITQYAIGDFIYLIFQDRIEKTYHISEHIIMDISAKGYVATCPIQVHDDERICYDETDKIIWSPGDLVDLQACLNLDDAKRIVKDMEDAENWNN